jgi:beta-xylosidase
MTRLKLENLLLVTILTLMQLDVLAASDAQTHARPAGDYPWMPDNGDGTYKNPIIHADYSDPDVVRVGGDFYMTASSFNCTPGLPILHSRDLVNWTLIGHALKNLPHPRYEQVQPGCGVWAPAIRFHEGKYWIFFPTPDEGIYLTTATNPAGPWSEPHLVQAGKGLIDPCPLWDDDGNAYLVHAYARSRAGIKDQLRVCPMSPDGMRLLGEGKIVFTDPKRHPTLEGPKFLKKGGWYYILAPAGGVKTGWQTVLRSKNIYGPYEDKIVLEKGSTDVNGPHQGALVDVPGNEWWFAHFQDADVYGRITHLQPVKWEDDWPIMGNDRNGNGIGEPVLHSRKPIVNREARPLAPQTSDEFDSPKLGLQWQWHANHKDDWHSLSTCKGKLRLFAQPSPDNDLSKAPAMLMQKLPSRSFVAETEMEFVSANVGEESGLAVRGRDYAAIAVRRTPQGHQFVWRKNSAEKILRNAPVKPLKLRVEVADGGHCIFSYDAGEGWIAIHEAFQASAGLWIGAKVGVYCLRNQGDSTAGHADFDYFRFSSTK